MSMFRNWPLRVKIGLPIAVLALAEMVRALNFMSRAEAQLNDGQADAALVFDYPSWWGSELDSHPTQDLRYLDRAHALYRKLCDEQLQVQQRDVGQVVEDPFEAVAAVVQRLFLGLGEVDRAHHAPLRPDAPTAVAARSASRRRPGCHRRRGLACESL